MSRRVLKTLNVRQKKFINEYLKCGNSRIAADRAGYAKGVPSIGTDLLYSPTIKAEIDRRMDRVAKKVDISIELILQHLKKVMETDVEFKGSDSVKAAELLGKFKKMWGDKLEVSGADGGPLVVEIRTYADKDPSES